MELYQFSLLKQEDLETEVVVVIEEEEAVVDIEAVVEIEVVVEIEAMIVVEEEEILMEAEAAEGLILEGGTHVIEVGFHVIIAINLAILQGIVLISHTEETVKEIKMKKDVSNVMRLVIWPFNVPKEEEEEMEEAEIENLREDQDQRLDHLHEVAEVQNLMMLIKIEKLHHELKE